MKIALLDEISASGNDYAAKIRHIFGNMEGVLENFGIQSLSLGRGDRPGEGWKCYGSCCLELFWCGPGIEFIRIFLSCEILASPIITRNMNKRGHLGVLFISLHSQVS